jgi:arginyl-tRNA synthetase
MQVSAKTLVMNATTPAQPSTLDTTLTLIARRLEAHALEAAPGSAPQVAFEAPRRREFGDFATNVAFGLAKAARSAPQKIAEQIAAAASVDVELAECVASVDAVAGFINIRLTPNLWQKILSQILTQGTQFGRGRLTGSPPVSLEFGSANPTGPLVVVQGRTLSVGATIAQALTFCGVPVTTEWIINDAGNQLETFGRSIYARYRQMTTPEYAFPEEGYLGEYVMPVAHAVRERDGNRWESVDEATWLPYFAKFGRDTMVADQQKICARFGMTYDMWQSEKDLHDAGAVENGIAAMTERGYTYESDGALWFAATKFNDDKDRVLKRSDGRPTYYAGDVAYHNEKYKRGAAKVIDILGPDHHGYIGRLKALAAALGHPDTLEVLIVQQMTLMRGKEQVSMSKRAGHVLTLEEVLDEVGVDAARFFFILSSTDSPLTFDLELAKRTTEENPVYYVQYGHARISSVVRKAPPELLERALKSPDLSRLTATSELGLIARLAELPAVVAGTATARAPHRLAKYARDVAADFHQFYAENRILSDDVDLSIARLALALGTKQILGTVLGLVGVSAPEAM